ncbi:MAG: helix-turn-helix domain-containing protein [Acetatifactor sp.]|nr:helix-turn-helix domain-containing protein [Acetatifactor sp.]
MDLHLGKIIKQLRVEQSVTQEELAEFLGISFQAVSKWKTGTT